MECQQEGCEKEATAIAHWPGNDTSQCEEHCRQLDGLNKVMGASTLRFTALDSGLTMEFKSKITSFGTISLGGLIKDVRNWLERDEEKGEHVMFDFGWALPSGLDSYRGYYDHLALGYEAGGSYTSAKSLSVEDFLKELEAAVGKTYEGWKGGDFVMSSNTPVWVDNSGHCSGTQILGLKEGTHTMIIHTCNEDDREYWSEELRERSV